MPCPVLNIPSVTSLFSTSPTVSDSPTVRESESQHRMHASVVSHSHSRRFCLVIVSSHFCFGGMTRNGHMSNTLSITQSVTVFHSSRGLQNLQFFAESCLHALKLQSHKSKQLSHFYIDFESLKNNVTSTLTIGSITPNESHNQESAQNP